MAVRSPALGRRLSPGLAAALLACLIAVVAIGRVTNVSQTPQISSFVLVFTSIVVEALPFVLLGALVSALIEVLVPDSAFTRMGRLPLALQLPGAALGGLAFPVCECGSVPVARRLISKGMHPAAGLAFMLASPIINPIVLWSTYVAYRGQGLGWEMLFGRASLGLILAIVLGWTIGTESASSLLRSRPEHDHGHDDHDHSKSRVAAVAEHLTLDFAFMARFVVIGAALAAALQTIVPQGIVSGVAGNPLTASLALMGLAFLLSLCSEADAFVAVSFTQFPLSAQLSFLVFGPVIDAKLSFLYGATFKNRFVLRVIIAAVPVVLAGAFWFERIVGQ
ncbi:MAG: uncharacterized protein QOG54_819 [Actinomycetota bacterium]|nr:uncharacterized protein [Actinomycetota bacterium]